MGYQFLAVRTAEEDDGSLYPVLGDADDRRNLIAVESLDGAAIDQAPVKAIYVRETIDGKLVTTSKLLEVEPTLYVTDARVAVACAKFDKGGGWLGFGAAGLVTAGVMNVASKARAAHRRKGKMLVGHARYPWISDVGFSPKAGMLSTEDLRVVVGVSENGRRKKVYLDFSLGRGADAARLAHSIARRCAGYRLAHDHTLTPEKREAYEALSVTSPREAAPKKFVLYTMPDYWFVSAKSAYPDPAQVVPASATGGPPASAPPATAPPPTAPPATAPPEPAPLQITLAPAPATGSAATPTAPPTNAPTRMPERLVVVLDPSDGAAPATPPPVSQPPAAASPAAASPAAPPPVSQPPAAASPAAASPAAASPAAASPAAPASPPAPRAPAAPDTRAASADLGPTPPASSPATTPATTSAADAATPATPAAAAATCPECAGTARPGAAFCAGCGTRLAAPA